MAIPREIRDFVNTQIGYYIGESWTYRSMAEAYSEDSVEDTAFGIILGCLYLGFMNAYRTRYMAPNSEDMDEFYQIIRSNASRIRKALQGPHHGAS